MNKYILSAVSLVLLASCTSDPKDEIVKEDTSIVTTTGSELDREINIPIESQDGLEIQQSEKILDVNLKSENELEIVFEMQSEECYGYETNIQESESEIVVAVLSGLLDDADPAKCQDTGVFTYSTTVILESPGGDRTIAHAEPLELDEVSIIDQPAE